MIVFVDAFERSHREVASLLLQLDTVQFKLLAGRMAAICRFEEPLQRSRSPIYILRMSELSRSCPTMIKLEEKRDTGHMRSPLAREKLMARFSKTRSAEFDRPSPMGGRSLRPSGKIQEPKTPAVKTLVGRYDSHDSINNTRAIRKVSRQANGLSGVQRKVLCKTPSCCKTTQFKWRATCRVLQ